MSVGNRLNGTGWRAQPLKRRYWRQTGTTNDQDTWRLCHGPGTVVTVWVGFDNHNRN
ncbi:hypothetical protein OH492_02675 [Vibrio chagasii]|nr:hypothetical protein [Vibrio chagasii]